MLEKYHEALGKEFHEELQKNFLKEPFEGCYKQFFEESEEEIVEGSQKKLIMNPRITEKILKIFLKNSGKEAQESQNRRTILNTRIISGEIPKAITEKNLQRATGVYLEGFIGENTEDPSAIISGTPTVQYRNSWGSFWKFPAETPWVIPEDKIRERTTGESPEKKNPEGIAWRIS